jgi:tripartite motif-containing protein 71
MGVGGGGGSPMGKPSGRCRRPSGGSLGLIGFQSALSQIVSSRMTSGRWRPAAMMCFGMLFISCLTMGSALADEAENQAGRLPTSMNVVDVISEASTLGMPEQLVPDLKAAKSMPHNDLDRAEAASLLREVFGAQLEAPLSVFGELEVEKFLSPDVAVIALPSTKDQAHPVESGLPSMGDATAEEAEGMNLKEQLRAETQSANQLQSQETASAPTGVAAQVVGRALLDSSVPLQTETASGQMEPIDLALEKEAGELQPANPLAEVAIPGSLGEGIQLPGADITLGLVGAPADRVPSVIGESVAFLPNVAKDTDLALVPAATGLETFTHLRSPDSPLLQTFDLSLPAHATLSPTDDGGATVISGSGEVLASVLPPRAIDARGVDVPVDLTVSQSTFTLTVAPESSAEFPILVDPLIQTYEWAKSNYWQSGLCNSSFTTSSTSFSCNTNEEWSYEHIENDGTLPLGIETLNRSYSMSVPVPQGTPGIFIRSSGNLIAGDKGSINYTVPRYFTDYEKYGSAPTSFISKMRLWNLDWNAFSSYSSPYVVAGLWDSLNGSSVSYFSHEGRIGHGLSDMSWEYVFPNSNQNTNVKIGYVSVQATETKPNQNTDLYVGSASIELADNRAPGIGQVGGPSIWIDQTALPLSFTASDSGLGIHTVTATVPGAVGGQSLASWKTIHGCIGVAGAACPREWNSSGVGGRPLKYEPSAMPTGINYLEVVAEDPVGNKSARAMVEVKVDHLEPQIALSGTMTEQAALGTKRPTYKLRVDASDGTAEQPQSGAAKVVIKVDGTVVDQVALGCATKSCGISREWTLDSSKYAAGQHTIAVTATDGVGRSATKTLTIGLNHSPPALALSGSVTEQATLGTTRPRYKLKVDASAIAGAEIPPTASPSFTSSFGSLGTAGGQFKHPAGIAVDAQGNLWVVDQDNDRVHKFNAASEYLTSFGSPGTGDGQFGRPTGIAIDGKGNLWVADAGNSRIQKFSATGAFLAKFGVAGVGSGQFSSPEGIAIDPKGNVWVADTYNGRLQKFTEAGAFVKVVGSYGSGQGQLGEPTDLDFGPGGKVWVADWQNNRISVFDEAGNFISQFGSYGTGQGQFNHPDVVDVDSKGNVWVGDQTNHRVQQFNQSSEFVSQFGTFGSGQGQFNFGWPMGIVTDSKGNIWISDTGNNRVQRWTVPAYRPVYRAAFGLSGSGDGQLATPGDIAITAEDKLWVADTANNRIQRFRSDGSFVSRFGSLGTENGRFKRPAAVAIDPLTHDVVVLDSGNQRVQRFSEAGQFVSKFGGLGSGNGQFGNLGGWFVGPEGLAVDSKGNIWVSDTFNNRVQKFNAAGQFLQAIGGQGSGPGQLSWPRGIAIDASDNLWVADAGNQRISVYSSTGNFLHNFGSAGSKDGQFSTPHAIDVDRRGNVWVADVGNHRIQQFNLTGEYVTQIGTLGSSAEQFNFASPMGLVARNNGELWITDPGNNRIQKWAHQVSGSEVATEISVDGKLVDSGGAMCSEEQCPITREWSLGSSSYAIGKHTVSATVTDGFGNTASKSLPIEIQRDTTKPAIAVSGKLIEAPEGWVEQGSYGLNATVTDAGYGVTSLVFKVDGQTISSVSKPCLDGGCSQALAKSLDMAIYSGGAHSAELIATDGAGNSSTQKWTINVDPEGHISSTEAAATLDAVENTSDATPIASTAELLEPEQMEAGDNPGLKAVGDELVSTGTPNVTTLSTDAEDGFSIDYPGGETKIVPAGDDSSASTIIVGGAAAVSANVGDEIDSVIRPKYNGVQSFQAIRSASAPTQFSWAVTLHGDQTLRLLDAAHAEVVYGSGVRAFLITVEDAHDATGARVPTSLQVTENILTLTVSHTAAPFVYPVVAGQGWEGPYNAPVVIDIPEDDTERKEREELERQIANGGSFAVPPQGFPENIARQVLRPTSEGKTTVPAPAYPSSGGATASKIRTFELDLSRCGWPRCSSWTVTLDDAIYERGWDWAAWEDGATVHCNVDIKGAYEDLGVLHADIEKNEVKLPYVVRKGEGKHLTTYCRFELTILVPEKGYLNNHLSFIGWVWPNGFQESVMREYDPPVNEL